MDPHMRVETGLVFLATFALLSFTQRALHRHLQLLLHRLTRHPDVALILYWALLFPGVFLHELSHWLAALLLGVRRYRFAWTPRRSGGRVRLGAVQLAEADPLRMSLIGAAPLIIGLAVIAVVGGLWAEASPPGLAAWGAAWQTLRQLPQRQGGWLAMYLLFTVGNAMWPSPSDRMAWPTVGAVGGLVALLLAFAGPASLHQALMRIAADAFARLTPLLAVVLFLDLPIAVSLMGLNYALGRIRRS